MWQYFCSAVVFLVLKIGHRTDNLTQEVIFLYDFGQLICRKNLVRRVKALRVRNFIKIKDYNQWRKIDARLSSKRHLSMKDNTDDYLWVTISWNGAELRLVMKDKKERSDTLDSCPFDRILELPNLISFLLLFFYCLFLPSLPLYFDVSFQRIALKYSFRVVRLQVMRLSSLLLLPA